MCKENRDYFIILLIGLLVSCVVGVVRGQEQPGPWYLISEAELGSIERYKEKSEQERRNWLLQVQTLKTRAVSLESESSSLNNQLLTAREAQRRSEQLYEQSEAEKLTIISSLNGQIVDKEKARAKWETETVKTKGQRNTLAVLCVALALAVLAPIILRILKIFRIVPG
jgi:hypothetical protein